MANVSGLKDNELIALENYASTNDDHELTLICCEELFHRKLSNTKYVIDTLVYSAVMLQKWDKAIEYGLIGLGYPDNYLNCLDGLSHAFYFKKDFEKCSEYGSKALYHRHNQVLKDVTLPQLSEIKLTEGKKVISFSLFGGNNPKYIEPAVLNTELIDRIYPDWICRFYVDDSIPQNVIQRLVDKGAEIYHCTNELRHIPKTMWRFLALDDEDVSCVIFRDADSVISPREAAAVNEWLESGKYFHTIRDNGSHTDLMMAGLWGARCGVLPNIVELMNDFVAKGNLDKRFADQHFLKLYLWKYIVQSLYATDSIFDFLDSHKFSGNQIVENFIGRIETFSTVTSEGKWADGTKLKCRLYSRIDPFIADSYDEFSLLDEERFICEYEVISKNQKVSLNLPRRYLKHFKYSRLEIKVIN